MHEIIVNARVISNNIYIILEEQQIKMRACFHPHRDDYSNNNDIIAHKNHHGIRRLLLVLLCKPP